jgi:predicted ATPase
MSIRLLEVEGFKSLKEVSWRPGNLNVVIGPNGSGKSNLLQLLKLIRAAARNELSATVQQEGGILALVWDGSDIPIRLRIDLHDELFSSDSRDHIRYELTLRPIAIWSSFRVEYERVKRYECGLDEKSIVELMRRDESAQIYDFQTARLATIDPKRLVAEEALLSLPSVSTSPELFSLIADFKGWSVYQALDTGPEAVVRQPALTRRETVVDTTGENLIAVLHSLYSEDRDFRNELNAAMRAVFNENFEELVFPPASDQRVQLRVHWKHLKRSQPSAMLSDGTLRFLWLMAILANPSPPPLIAIEEPEVGLHPSMFPIIAEYAAQAAQKTQVIFTTHSADFLDAFRHTGTTPTTTVTQWREGATHLRVLEGDELAYWLREYTLGQLFRSSELEQIG